MTTKLYVSFDHAALNRPSLCLINVSSLPAESLSGFLYTYFLVSLLISLGENCNEKEAQGWFPLRIRTSPGRSSAKQEVIMRNLLP